MTRRRIPTAQLPSEVPLGWQKPMKSMTVILARLVAHLDQCQERCEGIPSAPRRVQARPGRGGDPFIWCAAERQDRRGTLGRGSFRLNLINKLNLYAEYRTRK